MLKFLIVLASALCIIGTIIIAKYKPVYKVIISGQEVGYIEDKEKFEEVINNELFSDDEYNVAFVTLNNELNYEHKFINRTESLQTEEILQEIKNQNYDEEIVEQALEIGMEILE